jgi:hypothetical protein
MKKEFSMTAGPIQDWSSMKGKHIEIRLYGRPLDQGIIETTAKDGSVIWLESSGAISRRLYAKAEQYEAWPAAR